MVQKQDGSWRFCVDYRKVNSVTKRDAYPLPRIDATLDSLAGAEYFTVLDLASGYWQVEAEEDDNEKTAFSTQGHCACHIPATYGVYPSWTHPQSVSHLLG